MYFDKHAKGEYFDSYGLHPSMNGFTAFMERNSNEWVYNNKTVQSLFFATCGHYIVCILFCIVVVVIACLILFLISHRILLKTIATLTCLFVLSH